MTRAARKRYPCICRHCGMQIYEDTATRVPVPGLSGTHTLVCSREHGLLWLEQATEDTKRRQEQKRKDQRHSGKVQPAPGTDGACGCGCGGTPKSIFLPGHDSKLKSARRKKGLDPYTGEEAE